MPMFFGGTQFGQWTGQWQPGQSSGTFEERTAILPIESWTGDSEVNVSGSVCMSNDVDVWVLEAAGNYQDDISGVQLGVTIEDVADEMLHPQPIMPDEHTFNDLLEPGEPWHQTGPPTTWMDAVCAIPAIRGWRQTTTASSTTQVVNLPANMAIGSLVVVAFGPDGNVAAHDFTAPAGWNVTDPLSTTRAQGYFLYKIVDGTEGPTLTITIATANTGCHYAFEINGLDPYTGIVVGPSVTDTGTSAINPTPATLTWGADANVFVIEMLRSDADEPTTVSYPSNATFFRNQATTSTGGTATAIAIGAATGSFDSAAWGAEWVNGAQWKAFQLYVRGYCGDAGNNEPAQAQIPDAVEPEAVFDESWYWTVNAPSEDFVGDPDIYGGGTVATPDWVEPEAEADISDFVVAVNPPQSDEDIVCYYPELVSYAVTPAVSTAGTTFTVNLPASTAAGDAVCLIIGMESPSSTITVPAGWTAGAQTTNAGIGQRSMYRVLDGTEGSTLAVTVNAAGDFAAMAVAVRVTNGVVTIDTGTQTTIAPASVSFEPYIGMAIAFSTNELATAFGGYKAGWTGIAEDTTAANNGNLSTAAQYRQVYFDSSTTLTGVRMTWTSITTELQSWFAIKGVCYGPPPEAGTQWTSEEYHEPDDDVDTYGWVASPTHPDTTLNDFTGAYLPDTMELEDEPLQDGWVQSVVVEDFPPDTDITDRSIPDDMALEDEPSPADWYAAPLDDAPGQNNDCVNVSIPDSLEPEVEPLQDGWVLAPLEDTPADASIPESQTVDAFDLPDEVVDGWTASPWQDVAATPETPAAPSSVGTLPGHVRKSKWWLEDVSRDVKKARARGEGRWPNLPEPKEAPPWRPKVVTDKTARPRLAQIERDWKIKHRKVREAQDVLIATIIASLLSEGNDGNSD